MTVDRKEQVGGVIEEGNKPDQYGRRRVTEGISDATQQVQKATDARKRLSRDSSVAGNIMSQEVRIAGQQIVGHHPFHQRIWEGLRRLVGS